RFQRRTRRIPLSGFGHGNRKDFVVPAPPAAPRGMAVRQVAAVHLAAKQSRDTHQRRVAA
ncbi:MAG TPA: hypothetical protein PLP43_00005, partial [Methanoculleus sp.]|nr:hypothetical protein [Methanoculleus sp.]